MGKKIYKIIYTILVLMILINSTSSAQTETEPTKKLIEKFEFGVGLGIDHSVIGVKVKYKITESFGIYSSLGLSQIAPYVPPIGLQYNIVNEYKNKWTIYLQAQIGNESYVELFHYDTSGPPGLNILTERSKKFTTINTGFGLKYALSKILKLNFGTNYRFNNKDKIQEYVDDFNDEFGTDFNYSFRFVTPVIGVAINFD